MRPVWTISLEPCGHWFFFRSRFPPKIKVSHGNRLLKISTSPEDMTSVSSVINAVLITFSRRCETFGQKALFFLWHHGVKQNKNPTNCKYLYSFTTFSCFNSSKFVFDCGRLKERRQPCDGAVSCLITLTEICRRCWHAHQTAFDLHQTPRAWAAHWNTNRSWLGIFLHSAT